MSGPCPLDGTLGLLGHPPDAAAGSPRAGDTGEQGECGSACWGASWRSGIVPSVLFDGPVHSSGEAHQCGDITREETSELGTAEQIGQLGNWLKIPFPQARLPDTAVTLCCSKKAYLQSITSIVSDHSSKARHPGMWSQVGLRKHHYEQC